ncbi:cyclopropane fatty acyl phospholipid synthase [Gemmatimonadota bacterium]
MPSAKDTLQALLQSADIRTDGERSHDLDVRDDRFHARTLADGILGLGESYMDGWWDCDRLDVFSDRVCRADLQSQVRASPRLAWHYARGKLLNRQSRRRSGQVGRRHYDMGNEMFCAMLDPYMQYSCAYWQGEETLAGAQERKMDLICGKLGLREGMSLLDIGCGWGGLARYAAERHGVSVVGVTISKEQVSFAREFVRDLPVTIQLRDYREMAGEFDRVVSVGMFEHVGAKNYREFFGVARRCLKEEGLFLLQTIGRNTPTSATNPWTDKYIFPNGQVPSPSQVAGAMEGKFVLEDWHSFGLDYDKTLLAWWRNFHEAWPKLKEAFSDRFYRMWRFHLLTSAGAFRSRSIQLWQLVLSPGGAEEGYSAPR